MPQGLGGINAGGSAISQGGQRVGLAWRCDLPTTPTAAWQCSNDRRPAMAGASVVKHFHDAGKCHTS